jgi:hypothetical protein
MESSCFPYSCVEYLHRHAGASGRWGTDVEINPASGDRSNGNAEMMTDRVYALSPGNAQVRQ